MSDLSCDENKDLFAPRFIIEVMRKDGDCSSMLHVESKISCYGKNENLTFDNNLVFTINIPSIEDACAIRSDHMYMYNSLVVTQTATFIATFVYKN